MLSRRCRSASQSPRGTCLNCALRVGRSQARLRPSSLDIVRIARPHALLSVQHTCIHERLPPVNPLLTRHGAAGECAGKPAARAPAQAVSPPSSSAQRPGRMHPYSIDIRMVRSSSGGRINSLPGTSGDGVDHARSSCGRMNMIDPPACGSMHASGWPDLDACRLSRRYSFTELARRRPFGRTSFFPVRGKDLRGGSDVFVRLLVLVLPGRVVRCLPLTRLPGLGGGLSV